MVNKVTFVGFRGGDRSNLPPRSTPELPKFAKIRWHVRWAVCIMHSLKVIWKLKRCFFRKLFQKNIFTKKKFS